MRIPKIILASIVVSFFATSYPAISSESKGAWELYVVPEKYTINSGEELKLQFGLTGYGDIDPIQFKIVAYSEQDTIIQYLDSKLSKDKNIFTIFPSKDYPLTLTRFTSRQPDAPVYTIALLTDNDSKLSWLTLHPKSPGNKKRLLAIPNG